MLPFSLLPTPARLAVRALNALLAREAWARERLARHAGKTVRFALGGFTAGLAINSEGYADLADEAVVPDVTLTVDPAKFNPLRLLPG
ncbi:MAG TPA: SCP2 sterol-binding domain-containing protein, partial [Bordetella sp.]|nr:SCP2 sterol-binding domain-containing protein [Bordetella sp.]